jgi:hypothetical protein
MRFSIRGLMGEGEIVAVRSNGLAIVAADHSLNTTAIDLVGLSSTGVEYIL